jgi:hypothetical protein
MVYYQSVLHCFVCNLNGKLRQKEYQRMVEKRLDKIDNQKLITFVVQFCLNIFILALRNIRFNNYTFQINKF